jgi:hypothetical protein
VAVSIAIVLRFIGDIGLIAEVAVMDAVRASRLPSLLQEQRLSAFREATAFNGRMGGQVAKRDCRQQKSRSMRSGFFFHRVVERRGIEPLTSTMRTWRSPS